MIERVILVGFMCSGKSTVGRLLARRLDWEFIDFDEEIERARGERIPDIFRRRGEPAFRALEADLTRDLVDRARVVLAPGGGWMAQEELVAMLSPGSRLVWLQASPEAIYRRQRQQGIERPLLAVEDPLAAIRELLGQREVYYRKSDVAVDTDGRDPAAVVDEILARLRLDEPAAEAGDR